MKGARPPKGFTIVEIMIFLAVTSVLFVATIGLISNKQSEADFDQSIRDFQTQLQSIVGNVSNGYTNIGANFTCDYLPPGTPGSGIQVTSGAPPTGNNKNCIYVGQAIQFASQNTSSSTYSMYSLVGQRQWISGGVTQEVDNLSRSKPIALAPSTTAPYDNVPHLYEDRKLTGSTQFKKVSYVKAGTRFDSALIMISTTFPSTDGTTQTLNNGSLATDISVMPGNVVRVNATSSPAAVMQIDSQLAAGTNEFNPPGGVQICMDGSTDKFAVITLGGEASGSGQISTHLDIYAKGAQPAGVCG